MCSAASRSKEGTTSSSQVLKCRLLFCFAEASQPGYHGAGCRAAGRVIVDFGTDAVFQHPGLTKTSGHVPSSVCCLLWVEASFAFSPGADDADVLPTTSVRSRGWRRLPVSLSGDPWTNTGKEPVVLSTSKSPGSRRRQCVRMVRFPTLLAGGAAGATAPTALRADLGHRSFAQLCESFTKRLDINKFECLPGKLC